MDSSTPQNVLLLTDDEQEGQTLSQTIRRSVTRPVRLVAKLMDQWKHDSTPDLDAIIIASHRGPRYIQQVITALNEQAPDAPILVFSDEVSLSASKELLEAGAWKVLDINSKAKEMASGICDLVEIAEKGHISGVGLPVALQMLELERKTCTLTVVSGDRKGILFFKNGELIQAHTEGKKGLDAALEIASWSEVHLEFRNFCKTNKRTINTPLAFILLEATRKKDEEGADLTSKGQLDEQDYGGPEESFLEGLDDIDFDEKELNKFDLDQAMTSGPLAEDLQRIKRALARAIGPIANTVFRQNTINWAKDAEPTRENLGQLIDILCIEIEDEDLIKEFRKELGL